MTQLAGVVESAVMIFEESFNKCGFKITHEIERNIPEILIDPSVITQVFINMIKNAVEAMDAENNPEKKYELKVSLKKETRSSKDYAMIEIKDNGPGIPDDIKNKIFEFGFTTRTQIKNNITPRGIGLHFSMASVSKYGGTIEVDSKVGNGAAFKILLPVSGKRESAVGATANTTV